MSEAVSIVIPTRNRSAILSKCLAALPDGVRGFPAPHLIVVDDCSTDRTPEVVEDFRKLSGWQVTCLRQERPMGANAARNAALPLAQSNVICLIDDDAMVTEGWLSKLVGGLSERTPVVGGAIRLTLDGPILGRHREEVSVYLSESLNGARGADGETVPVACNMAAYRWVFDRAVFDEKVKPPTEEADWLRRTGVAAAFVPEALVWHYKTSEETRLNRMLRLAWFRGGEGGWWVRERLDLSFGGRLSLATQSLKTSARAFGHAALQRCWGGAVVGLGELSRALALAGLINRGPRTPESWR